MDPITVKLSALLLLAQALEGGGMDYVTLYAQPVSSDGQGCLHLQAYRGDDPALLVLGPPQWSGSLPACFSPPGNGETP